MIKDALYLLNKIHIWIAAAIISAFLTGIFIGYNETTAAIIFGVACSTVIIICDIMLKKIIDNLKI